MPSGTRDGCLGRQLGRQISSRGEAGLPVPVGRASASALTHLHLGINRALLTLQDVWGVSPRTASADTPCSPMPFSVSLLCPPCVVSAASSASSTRALPYQLLFSAPQPLPPSPPPPPASSLPSLPPSFCVPTTYPMCPAPSHSSPPLGLEDTCFVSVVS